MGWRAYSLGAVAALQTASGALVDYFSNGRGGGSHSDSLGGGRGSAPRRGNRKKGESEQQSGGTGEHVWLGRELWKSSWGNVR